MGFVDSKKLEMVANFIAELEVDGNCLCTYFNSSLNRNRVKVPCDTGCCGGVCPFYSKENFINWFLSEHKEPVKLTKFEYDFLNAFQDKESSYLARDKDGSIFLYLNKPSKEEEIWADYESSLAILDRLFKFVKWQDSEPISIKEILENCEVIEDESDG
jgi:hypothetical protein